MDDTTQITKSAGIISFLTILSRFSGLLREATFAFFFGTTYSAAAFLIAFRIPNLLRSFFGEGAFSAAFIPVFTEYLEKEKTKIWEIANIILNALGIVLLGSVILGILASPLIVKLITTRFSDSTQEIALVIKLTRIMFPYLFLISLAALFMGILHTFRHFLSPAFSPLALNVMFLLALLFICPLFGKDASSRIIGLTFGVLLGGLFQVLVQVPAVVARGFRYRVIIKFSHPAIKKLWSLMLPAFWGLSIAQINIFVDNALAWRLGAEAVASLNYSMRIIWFPLGVFGVAIGSAILPTCSHQITKGDTQALRNTLTYGINLALSLSLPASVVLIVLREPIIKLIFEQGIFNAASTQATTFALLFYSVGLVGFIGGKVLIPIFYSLKVPQIPVKTGVVCLSLNIILNIILMKPLRQGGLALATSISLVLNTILLGCFLYRKFKIIDGKDISKTFFKILLLSSILGGVLFGFHYFYQTFMREPGKLYLMLEILLSLGITIGTIFSLSYLLKVKELKAIPRIFRSG